MVILLPYTAYGGIDNTRGACLEAVFYSMYMDLYMYQYQVKNGFFKV